MCDRPDGCVGAWLEEAERIAIHPCFSQSIIRFGDGVLSVYRGDWRRVRAIGQHRRYGVAALIVHLDARYRLGLGPPPTRAMLTDLAGDAQLGTRRGVSAIVSRLQHVGFVQECRTRDRRERHLVPEESLKDHFAAALAVRLDAARLVQPLMGGTLDARDILPSYLEQLIAPMLERREQPRQNFPELEPFAHRIAGYIVLFILLAESERAGTNEPVRLQVSALSSRLAVSRAQIAKIVQAADRAGVCALRPRGMIQWDGAARQRLRFFVAIELARASHAALHPQPVAAAQPCRRQN